MKKPSSSSSKPNQPNQEKSITSSVYFEESDDDKHWPDPDPEKKKGYTVHESTDNWTKQRRRLSRVGNTWGLDTGFGNADVGEEPGIDVNRVKVEMPDSLGSHVVICDYSPQQFEKTHYDIQKDYNSIITGSTDKSKLNKQLVEVLNMRPNWSKVRWIVVNGMSWEALQPIAKVFQLHPLAIEDMLDIPQRTKSEVYNNQVFCCFPLHVMEKAKTPFSIPARVTRNVLVFFYTLYHLLKQLVSRSYRRRLRDVEQNEADMSAVLDEETSRCDLFYTLTNGLICMQTSPILETLSKLPSRTIYEWNFGNNLMRDICLEHMQIPGTEESLEITVEQVSIFMEGDTVITFFEKSLDSLFTPIEKRLQSSTTMLRITSDPAILLQAILDANVDLFKPILTEYKKRLSVLEVKGAKHPSKQLTRALHALRTDLTILRSPLDALCSFADTFASRIELNPDGTRVSADLHETFTAKTAALYFKDVSGHTLGFLRDVDNMLGHSEMLSSFICNAITMKGNDYVKMLSLVSIVFLPLTFLTGYFGMNFKSFDLLSNDVSYYWLVSAPATAALLGCLMYPSFLTCCEEFWFWAVDQILTDSPGV